MDDPVFKSKYQKYKYKVKLWEKQFKEKNGRVPSKVNDSNKQTRHKKRLKVEVNSFFCQILA